MDSWRILFYLSAGRKIEFRVITTGFYDNKDGTATDDESSAVNKMIIAIIVSLAAFAFGFIYTRLSFTDEVETFESRLQLNF